VAVGAGKPKRVPESSCSCGNGSVRRTVFEDTVVELVHPTKSNPRIFINMVNYFGSLKTSTVSLGPIGPRIQAIQCGGPNSAGIDLELVCQEVTGFRMGQITDGFGLLGDYML